MMVTQDRQFPLSTPLSTFFTLTFIWIRFFHDDFVEDFDQSYDDFIDFDDAFYDDIDPSFNVFHTHLHMDQVFIMMMIFVVILMVSLMIQITMKILNLKHSTFIELDQSLMLLLIFQYLGDCSVPCVWYSCPDMRQTC